MASCFFVFCFVGKISEKWLVGQGTFWKMG
jgi:hypothetical protein